MPGRWARHLAVARFQPARRGLAPVHSGVMLDTPNGAAEQPFFHVMFQSFTVTAGHPDRP